MTRAASRGELGDSLQKYLGRSAFLIPGSAWGLSWDTLLVEPLRDAEWWQVWSLLDDSPADPLTPKCGSEGRGPVQCLPALKLLLFVL